MVSREAVNDFTISSFSTIYLYLSKSLFLKLNYISFADKRPTYIWFELLITKIYPTLNIRMSQPHIDFLRHTFVTIAYRFQLSVNEASDEFGSLDLGHGLRTPAEITHHIFDLLNAMSRFIQDGQFSRSDSELRPLSDEIKRCNSELIKLDELISEKQPDQKVSKRLLQGPLADALTHVGQIAMMRRLNGDPIKGKNFASAPITAGNLSYF